MGIGKHTKPTKTRPSRGRKTPTDGVPQALTPEQVIAARRKQLRNRRDVTSFLQRLVIMVLMLWVLFGFVFGLTPMPNGDMSPRLSAGDLMLYYRMASTWHTQDIAVLEKDGTQYVARIVAQPGDTVEITKEATLKINDSVVLENDIYYSTPRYDDNVTYPVTLADDEYFVLCDYREGAQTGFLRQLQPPIWPPHGGRRHVWGCGGVPRQELFRQPRDRHPLSAWQSHTHHLFCLREY